ncbi:MAG: ABC transporter ATP-binding protein [Gammaproteobacteria bacterium]|nr:ABC transporter ATP-binding protein [Gammaproteobacteria bacterium]MCB1881300.1 ABC transporter ATP-binding protein [Gammaproteobacteria bacterium]
MSGAGAGNHADYVLHVEDVYKSYGDKLILDNIDVAVRHGELCTMVGPSGSGKSTLLRLILGQERATAGRLLIEGREAGYPDTARGIVFQRYSLFPHLTVLDNVTLGWRLQAGFFERRRRKKAFEEEALHYLERVRLADHAAKYPHELSGGMQQRVAIAQSLIMKPKILMMDEPFGALDPDTREEMQVFLLELWDEHKMTIFFVTHDLEEAAYLGTRILVISQYYSDDRGDGDHVSRGAKIVADYKLPRVAASTETKHTEGFIKLIEQIRNEGFNPKHLQHVEQFNLTHSDSFQTLTEHEQHSR